MTLVALASGRAVRALRPLARAAAAPGSGDRACGARRQRPAFLDAKNLYRRPTTSASRARYEWWEASGKFQTPMRSGHDAKRHVPMPPPNVTGRLHLGHAMFVALQDILARFYRMRGRPTL